MTERRITSVGAIVLCALASIAAYRLGRARADGVPTVNPLYYGGALDDGARPVEGTRNVTVRLWDAATGGSAACTTNASGTVFSGGRFRVALDTACAGAVRANPNLWAEVQVEGTTFPRSKLGAVPYALESGRATTAAGATGALETRIAAVEGRSRQVVVGSWRPATPGGQELVSVACPIPAPTVLSWIPLTGTPFALTFTASASSFYRIGIPSISAYDGTGASYPTRVQGVPSSTFTLFGDLVYSLDSGRSYAFGMEVQVGPSCRPMTVQIGTPFIVEQLN